MSPVQPPESASRAGRLDRILRDLLHQTPGVEAASVVSFDGLPMASALPEGMDEDRIAAMSAALLSLAERATQGLGRGDLSQVYIEGEHGTVFLVSAQDEGVLIAVTSAGAKVGMMLYEVKLAANRVGEVLHGPAPLPAPLPSNLTRGYLDEHAAPAAAPVEPPAAAEEPAVPAPTTVAEVAASYTSSYAEPVVADQPYSEQAYSSEPAYAEQAPDAYAGYYTQPAASAAPAAASSEEVEPTPEPASWSSYAPSGSVLPSERSSWS